MAAISYGSKLCIGVTNSPDVGLTEFTQSELDAMADSLVATFPDDSRVVYYGENPPYDRNLPWQKTLADGVTPVGGIQYFAGGKWVYPEGAITRGEQGKQGEDGRKVVSPDPPSDPFEGMNWFNSSTGMSYTYYDNYWVSDGTETGEVANAILIVSETQPVTEIEGAIWFNSATGITYKRYDSAWVQ